MIDARRWILVEAWLSLGLRIEWCPSYDRDRVASAWLDDDGGAESTTRFVYDGHGRWLVDPPGKLRFAPPNTAPSLTTAALRHELAHYLTATEDERSRLNFGASAELIGGDERGTEDRAVAAEKVIDAMLAASARIANMALGGRS